jgi:heptosyltransferase-2
MHGAAAFNTPQIAIIGPTHYQATGPSNPAGRIVRVPTSCAPCRHKDCPIDHRCMTRITPDMVFDAAETVLEHM